MHPRAVASFLALLGATPGCALLEATRVDAWAARSQQTAEAPSSEPPTTIPWERARDLCEVTARYRSDWQGASLELVVARRPGVRGRLAVLFPPGTYATREGPSSPCPYAPARGVSPEEELERRSESWPAAGEWARARHDLLLLRAPVALLGPDQGRAAISVPIACATFGCGVAEDGQTFELRRVARLSPAAELASLLCAGAGADASETAVQLAVWLAWDDITREQLLREHGARGRLVTLGSYQLVGPSDASGAARLLQASGIEPGTLRFFARGSTGDGAPD